MSKQDDASQAYAISNKMMFWMNCAFWICFIIPFFLAFLDSSSDGNLNKILLMTQCALSVIYVLGEIIDKEWLFYGAEELRRKLWLNHGFNSQCTAKTTEEYYNNTLQPSFIKLSLDSYESCFFSTEVLKRGLWKQILKTLIAITIWVILSFYNDNISLIMTLIQSLFSGTVLITCIEQVICYFRLKSLKEKFYIQFFTIGINKPEQLYILFNCVIDYEFIKAYYHLRLSSKTFIKMNPELTNEWQEQLNKMPNINKELLSLSFPVIAKQNCSTH